MKKIFAIIGLVISINSLAISTIQDQRNSSKDYSFIENQQHNEQDFSYLLEKPAINNSSFLLMTSASACLLDCRLDQQRCRRLGGPFLECRLAHLQCVDECF